MSGNDSRSPACVDMGLTVAVMLTVMVFCSGTVSIADAESDFEKKLEERIKYIGNTDIIRYDYFQPSAIRQVVWEHSLDDDIRISNHIGDHESYLNVSLGKRFGPGDVSDFRWRIRLAHEEEYGENSTGGFTVFDYDKSGVADLDARWINVRGGPALTFGGKSLALETRLIGSVGLGSILLGQTNFPDLGPNAGKRQSYKEAGFTTSTAVRLAETALVSTYYTERHLFADIKTGFTSVGIEAVLWLRKIGDHSVKIVGRLEREETEFDNLSQDSKYLKVGVQFNRVREEKPKKAST